MNYISLIYRIKKINILEEEKKISFYGHIAKMPKNVKASNSIGFLEKIKISKLKLWYIIIEKEEFNELQTIKYNNRVGVNLKKFVLELKSFYSKNPEMMVYIDKLVIDGTDKFSIIRNVPNVEINGVKLMTILTNDLIKLLK